MPAEHHDFIFQIRTRNLSDRVVAHRISFLPLDRQIDSHPNRLARLQHPYDAVVVLDCENELRSHFRCVLVVWSWTTSQSLTGRIWIAWCCRNCRRLHKDSPAIASARIDEQRRAFSLKEADLG